MRGVGLFERGVRLGRSGFAVALGVLEGPPYGPAAAFASCSASKAGGSMPAIP